MPTYPTLTPNTPTISGLSDRERAEDVIEIATDKPKLAALTAELQKGTNDAGDYLNHCDTVYDYWHCEWEGQSPDGRKHDPNAFPWFGASDTRVRFGEKFVRQHVCVEKSAIMQARMQATATQPAVHGREAGQGTQLLKWVVNAHMRDQVQREIPLGRVWRAAYGASVVAIEWEQEERISEEEISLTIIDKYIQQAGGPPAMLFLQQALFDPDQEEGMIGLLQRMSDIVTRREAKSILRDLRQVITSVIPVRLTYKSQPRWTALRIGVDIIFPAGTGDLQRARWIARRELVTRGELLSRIRTEDYDPDFVEELLRHPGQVSGSTAWLGRTGAERAYYRGGRLTGEAGYDLSYGKLYELTRMIYKTTDRGVPCIYQTIFNPNAMGSDRDNPLYATHGRFTYKHGMYPYVAQRAEMNDGPILSSRGIPEIAYTWENEIKTQRDARTDMAALELGPPMIVTRARAGVLEGYPLPRSILPVDKANDFAFMPTPPLGQRSIESERATRLTAAEFFGLFDEPGEAPMDPDWKALRRGEVSSDALGEHVQIVDQTFMLLQEFMTDSEVQAVIGPHSLPFPLDMKTIVAKHQISAAFDARMLDVEWAKEKMELVQMAIAIGSQSGRINESALPEVLLNIADPSLADLLLMPAEDAADKERVAAKQAVSAAFNGIVMDPPMHANHKLRLQTILESTVQSQNPEMQKRLAQNPDTVEILKQMISFHQNQLQQYGGAPGGGNPQIGRTLATAPFAPKQALPTVASAT